MGDIQNSKNKAYMDKLKAEFKAAAQRVKKKNDDLIQKISAQILDQLFAMAAKQKNYQSIHDVQADIQYISQEYQNQIQKQFGLKDSVVAQNYMHKYLLAKSMTISADVFRAVFTNLQNQLITTTEKMKQAESGLVDTK